MTATSHGARFDVRALERLLRPGSVAVVGASSAPGALGTSTIANLDRLGFSGELYLINPKRDAIGNRPCLKSVDELPLGVDVALLAVPRSVVLDTVRALVRREVGAAVIFSAGFAEGGDQGLDEQKEIARIASDCGMVIEGPNCLGLVNYVDQIALTFVETPAIALNGQKGIGIVSQSGAMAAVLSVMLTSRDLGLTYCVSTGNEASIGVEDFIDYLLDDPHTGVIGMIVEQFRQPRYFLQLARRARIKGKQIVLLHPGRSSAARDSAITHTGALAPDYGVMRTLVEHQGVLVAENLEELGDLLEVAMRCSVKPAGGAAVLTESGAFKALTLDLCEQLQLTLPPLDNENAPLLRAELPGFVPVSNPVDLTAQALVDPGLYRRSLSALLHDDRFGSFVFGIIQTDAATSNIKFPAIIAAVENLKPRRPVIFAGLDEGAAVPPHYIAQLRALGVPYFRSPDRAIRAVARFSALAARTQAASCARPTPLAQRPPVGVIAEYRAKQLLARLGIEFAPGHLVQSLEQAQVAASSVGFPVVIKAQSSDLSHKSDVGGVLLNLRDPAELSTAWTQLHASVAVHRPGLVLDGVLLEKMCKPGVEMIVGARNDPEWGPIVLAGFGGVHAEVLQDVRLLPADLDADGIARELYMLKSGALLRGFRGSPALDVDALADLIARVGRLLLAERGVRELDLNPVVVYPQGEGVLALDALMLVNATADGGTA